MIFKSLISRVIILILLILTLGVGAFSLIFLKREHGRLIDSARETAELLLSTVDKSICNTMGVGNSGEVQVLLQVVGRSHRLSKIRIFKPDGTIMKSSYPAEIGEKIHPEVLRLFKQNVKDGIYRNSNGDFLSVFEPIQSEERCYGCHGQGPGVIGVLNLDLSLAPTIEKLRTTTEFFLISTGVIILLLAAGITFVLLRFVKRPIQEMASKMAQVESGDLSVRLEPRFSDEIGSLMNSFNSMVLNLERAKNELEKCHYQHMERADRLATLGELSTGIAHEIKNPLAAISGAISVLAYDFEEEDPRKEIIQQVLDQITRLDKTATDLLHFGRPGKPEFSYQDINALVNQTLFFVSQHPESRNVHRVKELTRDLPAIWVDEKQIQQVLFNITINGIQAMKEGGTLVIETDAVERASGEFVRVRVRDTGSGIPPQEMEKIFTPFHTTKTQGTGLGLPISRQLLEQHGGRMEVHSVVGEGTTFTIELPVVESPVKRNEVICA